MKPLFSVILLLCVLVAATACEGVDVSQLSDEDMARIAENAIVCEPPYIRFGMSCCIDQNENKICDEDETQAEAGENAADAESDDVAPEVPPTNTESTGTIIITSYIDYECPYTKKFITETLPLIEEEFGDQVEFEFKHFPLSFHDNAQEAAEAAECARDQGKFAEYSALLFDSEVFLVSALKEYASALNLEQEVFSSCLDGGVKESLVQNDFAEGQNDGVRGTPSLLIDDQLITGALPFDDFKSKLDAVLAGGDVDDVEVLGEIVLDVPSAETPVVELFVMSECPFGLQMEKAFIPVAELFGDKADMEVKFVNFAMNGLEEVEENTRQYCIQKEQSDVWLDYLTCYIETKNSPECQESKGVDTDRMDACVDAANEEYGMLDDYNDKSTWLSGRYPQYNLHKAENTEYGVRGSPTIVINGQTVNVNRTPEALKQAVCAAFTNPPSECDETLSDEDEAAGHGPIQAVS